MRSMLQKTVIWLVRPYTIERLLTLTESPLPAKSAYAPGVICNFQCLFINVTNELQVMKRLPYQITIKSVISS